MDKKLANILLLSDEMEEYQTLVDAGYKNVFWFKSILRAKEYFNQHEDELKKFDIILMGSSSLESITDYKYKQFYKMINGDDDVPYIRFFSKQKKLNEPKKFYIVDPSIPSFEVFDEQFLSVLNDSIPEELKGEVIEISEVEEKEIVLPKKREDVKVLFMGYSKDYTAFKQFFEDAGFTNYKFIQSCYYSLGDNIESLVDYDLVVVDAHNNANLSLFGDEFQDYMKDKGRSIYFAIYRSCYFGVTGINDFYMEGFTVENPNDKKEIRFKSMENVNDIFIDVMGLVVNSYCSYNKNMGDGGYPTQDELNKKYEEHHNAYCEQSRLGVERIYELVTLQRYLDYYRTYINNGVKMPSMKGLSIDILENGVSVAFLAEGRECVRLTFRDEDRKPGGWCYQFYLEYLSEKGKPNPSVMRNYYEYYDPSIEIENLASDEEMKKLSVVYNRMREVLKPIIDKMQEKESSKEEKKYKNKKYNKRYFECNNRK